MPITPFVKTFAPQAAHLVRVLCHYATKYQSQLNKTIDTVVTDPVDNAALKASLAAIIAACAVWNKYWPPEAS
jgi:hypothetical protein